MLGELRVCEKGSGREMEDDEMVKEQALQILDSLQVVPRLVVFDLDYTLWPFYCECLSRREMPYLYFHAKGILLALKDKNIDVAVASRSPAPDIAKAFLDRLGVQSMFVAQEIYPSWTNKTEHFQNIQRRTQIPYSEMLFFDDEDRNIITMKEVGVTSILVDGINLDELRRGLTEFSQKNAGSSGSKRS